MIRNRLRVAIPLALLASGVGGATPNLGAISLPPWSIGGGRQCTSNSEGSICRATKIRARKQKY
ncbi:hypothetical protein [Candidatus Mycoplasma haematominutum]|uniref:Uncharacterized protein n=1 Tax=Candidatus Mycoplasma haematominutum 'Birmingham 1' TaxID=1116213 RepID=G8C3H0_9MOLU|nr:hypothetical protein [Candidatus Mycoplasma haematominutum]CCE66868.1 hypothetical protein MHM_03500 [Candidatus Mycoplasma haematominutum 'Birmingham 1']